MSRASRRIPQRSAAFPRCGHHLMSSSAAQRHQRRSRTGRTTHAQSRLAKRPLGMRKRPCHCGIERWLYGRDPAFCPTVMGTYAAIFFKKSSILPWSARATSSTDCDAPKTVLAELLDFSEHVGGRREDGSRLRPSPLDGRCPYRVPKMSVFYGRPGPVGGYY